MYTDSVPPICVYPCRAKPVSVLSGVKHPPSFSPPNTLKPLRGTQKTRKSEPLHPSNAFSVFCDGEIVLCVPWHRSFRQKKARERGLSQLISKIQWLLAVSQDFRDQYREYPIDASCAFEVSQKVHASFNLSFEVYLLSRSARGDQTSTPAHSHECIWR